MTTIGPLPVALAAFDNRVINERLPDATLETVQMVGFSSLSGSR